MNWGYMEEYHCRVQSEGERFFELGGIQRKYSIRYQISRSKTRFIVLQHMLLFNQVNDLFKRIEGRVRSFIVRLQSEAERIFDIGGIQKKYSIRCQISHSKTRYIVFQHKSLLNLVKDLFKWIEGLGRSVTVRVQSEGGTIFWARWYTKKSTRYVVKFRAQKHAL